MARQAVQKLNFSSNSLANFSILGKIFRAENQDSSKSCLTRKNRSTMESRKNLRHVKPAARGFGSRDESRKKLRHVKPAARGFGSRDGREGAKG